MPNNAGADSRVGSGVMEACAVATAVEEDPSGGPIPAMRFENGADAQEWIDTGSISVNTEKDELGEDATAEACLESEIQEADG
jgi:hypothetical protein